LARSEHRARRDEIGEGVEQTVYLVPEQYKGMENYNFDYFTSVREGRYDLHSDLYNQEDKASSMDIKFIYTKSGQEIFSFNPDVMPNHHNMIVDPIIQVMTEANALVPDVFYTSSGDLTLFIKLIDNDQEETYGQLLSELVAYELDDNFPYLVQPNEIILEEINDLQQEAAIIGYILLFSSVLLIMILAQNVYLQFERNRFEYFLKKTFGHTFFMKYKKIVLLLLLTNLLEFIVCFEFIGPDIFNIFVVKMLVETCLVIGLTIYHEGKNVTKVLKEGV
jgi:putative ABC transport system permease protein